MMPLSVGAAADWLRSLVKAESTSKDRLATHSCKATMLSMSAKFGLDHATRRLLGYHSSGRDQSLLTYSRDAMSAPLRKLVTVITAVRREIQMKRRPWYLNWLVIGPRPQLAQQISSTPDTGSRVAYMPSATSLV